MYTEVCGFVIVHYYTVYYSILPCSAASIFVPFKLVPLMIYYLYFVNQFIFKFRTRKDLDHTKCKRYEKSVNDMMTAISSMINPLEFSKKHLLGENPDIFTKLKQNKLQTFSSTKSVSVKNKEGKKVNIMLNRNLFPGYWSLPRVARLILRNYFHIALELSHFCCLQQQEDL